MAPTITDRPGVSLSDDLPLRTTADWGEFETPADIPLVYGDLSGIQGACIPYDATRRLWCIGDGVLELGQVWSDGEPLSGVKRVLQEDASGKLITLADLGAPAADGAVITAGKRGRRHPETGALLTNPAEIIHDLLNWCGIPTAAGDLDRLRAECARLGVAIGGEFTDGSRSIRSAVDEIAAGIGAIWTEGLWRLYPSLNFSVAKMTLHPLDIQNLALDVSAADTAGRVQIRFDFQSGTGRYGSALTRGAYDPPYGDHLRTIESRWIRDRRAADDLAERHLRRLAGGHMAVRFAVARADIDPGDALYLTHPYVPGGGGDVVVLSPVLYPERASTDIDGEVLFGQQPRTRLLSVTTAFPAVAGGALDVAYDDGVATFTVLDEDGNAAVGADVSLDGGYPMRTGPGGQVSFADVKPGKYKVGVELAGYLPMEMEVTLG